LAKHKVDSQEIGLVAGLILGKYFFRTDDLHYGYWPEGLEVSVENFPEAQEHHSGLIIKAIPEGVKTVLDVGCGVGTMASRLLEKGYEVDCISPSPMLSERARAKLGDRVNLHECYFEDFQQEKKYDLVMFSESFQYIKLKPSLEKIPSLLNEGGHLLICDFFKTDAPGKSALGGGHRLARFYELMKTVPLENIEDSDITEFTAPNLDLISDMMEEVGKPLWDLIFYYLDNRKPFLSRLLKWKFRKKIPRIEQRYFAGERNGEMFRKYKSYRLLLYKLSK
jgi:SAM-dependent methyltransferase